MRQYLSDDWGGDREVHGRLQTSPLQTGADGQLQVKTFLLKMNQIHLSNHQIQISYLHSSWSICWIGCEWIKVQLQKNASKLQSIRAGYFVRFLETETAEICIDFSGCGPCYESKMWA